MFTDTYNINLVPGGPPTFIHISQSDGGLRKYTFTPYSTLGDFDFSSVRSVTLEATKPDGFAVMDNCTWNGSTHEIGYTLNQQLAAVPGNVWSKLVIRDSVGNPLGMAAIIWIVDKAGINDGSIVSDSDLSALEEFMQEFEALYILQNKIEAAYNAIPYYTASNEALNFDI